MRIEMPTHSEREDIHFVHGDTMTVLSDREINEGDEITSPHKRSETHYEVYHVKEITEKRRPMGDWKSVPPILYKIRFVRELIEIEYNNG